MFFSLVDQSCEFWGENCVQVPFSSYHIKGIYYQHELSLMMLGINYFKMRSLNAHLLIPLWLENALKMNGVPAKTSICGK